MNEEDDTIVRFNLNHSIHGRTYHHHRSQSNSHNQTISSSTSSSSSSSSIQMGRTLTKPNPRFLAFFLQVLVMAVVISLFFLFVGIAAIVLIHIAIAGRAIHRRRYRRSSASTSPTINMLSNSFEDDLDIGGIGFGLSHRDLKKLPTFYYGSNDKSYSGINQDCSVCLEGFRDGDCCRILQKCKHVFHVNCVDSWLIRVPACPVCRGIVDPKIELVRE